MLPVAVFSPLVTVNNLGLRRFIALHSKCSRRSRILWPSYWSNWEDVQQSKRNSWEPHRMHAIRTASGPLLAYGWSFSSYSGAWCYLNTIFGHYFYAQSHNFPPFVVSLISPQSLKFNLSFKKLEINKRHTYYNYFL